MKHLPMLLAALLATLAFALPAAAESKAEVFTAAEEEAITRIVRDYLVSNPDVMIDIMDAFEAKEAALAEERARDAIAANREAIERDGHSYVAGNPDGAITVVEFFDYRCPYCKTAAEDVRALISRQDDVRVVLKEFPILGPDSTVASKAAIAAIPQGGYLDFHFALLANEGKLDRDRVMEIAGEVGLDTERLARDMDSARVDAIIEENRNLAREIGVRGTPAFVIGDQIVPGAIPVEDIEARIEAARLESERAG